MVGVVMVGMLSSTQRIQVCFKSFTSCLLKRLFDVNKP